MSQHNQANIGMTFFLAILSIGLIIASLNKQATDNKSDEELKKEIVESVRAEFSEQNVQGLPDGYSDYNSLSAMKRITLVEGFYSSTPTGVVKDGQVANRIILQNGSLSKAYI